MSKLIKLLSLVFIVVTAGCSSDDNPTPSPSPGGEDIILTRTEETMVELGNDFAFRFFQEVYQNEKEKNFMVSPLSVSLALAMTNNGAVGNTGKQMMEVLGFSGYSRDEMNAYFQKIANGLLVADPKVELGIANSIWVKENFFVKQPFINTNKNYYNASVDYLDFENPSSVDVINKWCADNTNNRIDKMIEEIKSDVVMYLMNALYFKGEWTIKFDKEKTYEEGFINEDGEYNQIAMMHQDMELNLVEDELFTLGVLPYGNGRFNMAVLIPDYQVGLKAMIDQLTLEKWKSCLDRMVLESIPVALPQFKIEYEKKLNDLLISMGMIDAFGMADFSDMADGDLSVGEVKQKTFIEVNEEGTEAAAVTSVEMIEYFVPRSFIVNRPFIFIIYESTTNSILFMGKVREL